MNKVGVIVAVAFSVAMGACGGGSGDSGPTNKPSTPKATATTESTSHLPSRYLGTYDRTTASNGSESFTLYPDDFYAQKIGNCQTFCINGTWAFHDGKITFTEVRGKGACIGQPGGTYTWSLSGKMLTLGLVNDPCGERADDLPLAPWTKRA